MKPRRIVEMDMVEFAVLVVLLFVALGACVLGVLTL